MLSWFICICIYGLIFCFVEITLISKRKYFREINWSYKHEMQYLHFEIILLVIDSIFNSSNCYFDNIYLYMKTYEPKWINLDNTQYGVNSLRVGFLLYMSSDCVFIFRRILNAVYSVFYIFISIYSVFILLYSWNSFNLPFKTFN